LAKLKSDNGWPASKDPAEIGIKSYPIPGTGIKIRCAEKVAPLLVALCTDFHKLVEPINEGSLDDWGYNFRIIRNSTDNVLSNHASGTAVDLNANDHFLGKRETFTMEQETTVRQIAAKYGCRWGGDYKNRADEMHFEISLTPKQAKERITALGLDMEK